MFHPFHHQALYLSFEAVPKAVECHSSEAPQTASSSTSPYWSHWGMYQDFLRKIMERLVLMESHLNLSPVLLPNVYLAQTKEISKIWELICPLLFLSESAFA